jgi:hypothetical protein
LQSLWKIHETFRLLHKVHVGPFEGLPCGFGR